MKKFLKNFDSPFYAFLVIAAAIVAIVFLGAGIFQAYVHFKPIVVYLLIVGAATALGALAVIGYWIYKLFDKPTIPKQNGDVHTVMFYTESEVKLIATRFARQSRLMNDITSNDTIQSFDNWFKPENFKQYEGIR